MEKREVFLEKNKSKVSVNKESEVPISLSGKTRLLPYNSIDEKLSLIKLYNSERDACNRYRMIFTINPICTNVLFNTKTEVVRLEGSNDCNTLPQVTSEREQFNGNTSVGFINNSPLNTLQAIRDTEYTHKDLFEDGEPYVYHCGWDIFNNHMLRSNNFTYVSKINESDSKSKSVFNTIKDYSRDKDGNIIKEKISWNSLNQETEMHIYEYDNILSMYNAFKERLDEKDGWYGFVNPGNVVIPNATVNEKEISINKMMNNNKSCELYELYPDQSLFSFIPKVNKFRNRLEYNWDYDIVYPYENEYDKLKEIVGATRWGEDDFPISILSAKRTSSTSANDFVLFKTMLRHTFEVGDYVRIYFAEGNSIEPINRRFKVVRRGDNEGNNTDRYFCVRATDFGDRFSFNEDDDVVIYGQTEPARFFYKKDVNGYECKYYIRKFKRVKTDRFESEINKLAFGENIYGDRMAQIIFTDDIDIDGLVDNLGRPLSEVYLYMFKTNRGYEKWYNENKYKDEDIEFSHCFGKLTSGLDLPSECIDFNVRALHNVDKSKFDATYYNGFNYVFSGSIMQSIPKVIDDDLTLSKFDNEGFVYGDIVEFDPVNYEETVIEDIYHRFNTAQRETTNSQYFHIWDDEIKFDDYDADINKRARTTNAHEVELKRLNIVTVPDGNSQITYYFPGNIAPEGYFYNPKTVIKLADVSDTLSSVIVKQIKYKFDGRLYNQIDGYDENNNPVNNKHGIFTISTKYDFIKGDLISLYQANTKIYHGCVWGVSGNTIDVAFEGGYNIDVNGLVDGSTAMLTTRDYVAPYATFLPTSRAFVWRSLIKPSELPNDSTLYDRPFANGCFYVHQNVNFFLKRQDPRNEFGLLYPENANDNIKPITKSFKKPGNREIDLTSFDIMNEINNICY